jgi:hypothetical protein
MKYRILAIAAPLSAALLLVSPSMLQGAEPPRPAGTTDAVDKVVSVYPDWVLEKNFLGFGVQWEYEGDHRDNNVDNPVWMKRWPEIQKRIDFMRPAMFRVMHSSLMYTRLEQDKILPDYDSPRMQVMYMVLDYAKSRSIPVVFGDWFLPGAYFKPLDGTANPPLYGLTTNPVWTDDIIAPFLAYLREKRDYTNIAYFTLVNEPTDEKIWPNPWGWAGWRTAILNLHAALKKQGLEDKIQIVGTDGPGDFTHWIERVAQDPELRECIGAYEYHFYASLKHMDTRENNFSPLPIESQPSQWAPSLVDGKMETGELLSRRLAVETYDPKGASKPFFMGEVGIRDDMGVDNQIHRYEFSYGVWMADYAIQSIRAGLSGLIAWDMDDAMHTHGTYGPAGLKGWGFWNSLAGCKGYPEDDFKLRPWYYTWSLLCRLFPAGSQSLMARDTGDAACRVAAARLPDGKGLSFAVVNESSTALNITLKIPGADPTTLYEYRYFADDQAVDQEGFPVTSAIHQSADLSSGFQVKLPGKGVVFLTTRNPKD